MDSNEQQMADEWAAALSESAEAVSAPLEDLEETAPAFNEDERRKLDTILDIPVTISMEVGRSHISIRNLLQLNQGSVVELDRIAGESLTLWLTARLSLMAKSLS